MMSQITSPRGTKRPASAPLSEIDSNTAHTFAYADYANDLKKRRMDADSKTITAKPLNDLPSRTTTTTSSSRMNTSGINSARTGARTMPNSSSNTSRVNNTSRLNTSTATRGGATSATNSSRIGGINGRTATSTNTASSRLNTSSIRNNTSMTATRSGWNGSARTGTTASAAANNTSMRRTPQANAIARQKQEEQNAHELEQLRSEITEYEFKCQQIQVNYDSLRDQFQHVVLERDSLKSAEGLNAEMTQMTRKLNEATAQASALQSQIEKLSKELEESQRDYRALRERYNALEDRAARIQKDREEDDARHRREKIDMESRMDAQRREHSLEVDELRTQQDKQTRDLKDDFEKMARNTKMEHERVVTQLQNENRTLRIDLDFSENTCKNQKEKIEQLEATLKEKLSELQGLEQQLVLGEEERRQLHNTIIELKGNIRVFCRVRPANGTDPAAITWQECDNLVTVNQKDKKMNFNFDRVFGAESGQEAVFSEISQLVQSALDGYKVSIFAYGQTGSGKTYTMEGVPSSPGVIPQSVRKIFHTIEVKRNMREFKQWSYKVSVSYLEIYNEAIRDLLEPANAKSDIKLDIKHENGVSSVTNLTTEQVDSPEEVMSLLRRAAKNRSVASTNMNERSSRSHSVFTLSIYGTNAETMQKTHGVLNLIDLAGSERLNSSGATGDRMKETKHINSSLSCLGDVIFALSKKAGHVPYRNSKLTYLLQPYLDGEGKCLMFVNVGPEEPSANETLCSLRFAAKVNGCDIGVAQRRIK